MSDHSQAWISYSYASTILAITLMLGGIWFSPLDMSFKAYFAMGTFFMISSVINLTKTMRDKHEGERFSNKLEEAKTEKILREFDVAA